MLSRHERRTLPDHGLAGMRCFHSVALFTTALVAAAAASAAAPELAGRAVAATCSNCHTASGERAIPPLEGGAEAELRTALAGFRSGQRPGTVMPQLAKGYSDAQLDAVARWYANQPRAPAP